MNIYKTMLKAPTTGLYRYAMMLLLLGLCQVAIAAMPTFNPAPCSFDRSLTVEILASEGDNIYFSNDGSTPTADERYKYNGPVVISSTTTFKAIAVDSEGNISQVATAKYTCTHHGIGEDYNPGSPGNPGSSTGETQQKGYKLTVVANPAGAGSVYANSYDLKAGTQTNVYCYNNTGFVFLNWTIEGTEVSKAKSFYYVMPEYDVTIVANYEYAPQNPGDPSPLEQKVQHPVTVRSMPSGAASLSPSGVFNMDENASRSIYAYPNTGWKLTGWTINGEQQQHTSSPLSITMREKALDIVAHLTYDPTPPSNPAANYYNPTTGQVIIDDFVSGSLYSALSSLVGSQNFSSISSLIVKGEIASNDLGNLSYFSNAETIDISRTGGVNSIPGYTFSAMGTASLILPSTISSIGNYAFSNCGNLASLTIYAHEPPTCTSTTFNGFTNKANCTVYVPASAIELYTNADYWKDFTILPISTSIQTLQINLPAEASDGRYKNYSLEIVNINSGVRQKYVISNRLLYTFSGLQKDEQYNVYMFSQAGLEIGRIENVTISNQDIEVTFNNLKTLHSVSAKVLTEGGQDVTSITTIEWLNPHTDGTTTYLRKSVLLGEIPEGQNLLCRVTLNSQTGAIYATPNDIEFTVADGDNTCIVTLTSFRSIDLSGNVVDSEGAALSGASISINQTLNGKYSKTYTTKTDRKGAWSLSVLDAPETRLTYAATECININDTIGAFDASTFSLNLGKKTLKSIVGARITYGFTYHATDAETVESYYSDYQNVAISAFNVTQNRAHNEVSLQYPILAVLDENINIGDELRLTATSKKGAFNPIEKIVAIGDNQQAAVTFDIIGKGGISATFEMTDNPSVIAMLYSSKGELLKKLTYSETKVAFTELEDGDYTLVSMGQSSLMNAILRLSNFSELGLTEGKDYIKNAMTVESGKLTEVKNPEIPAFDESLFYYTNSSTGFSSNKSSITTGNFLTLRAAVDFKSIYKSGISNVALVVDLPDACDFVEQSVIQGPNLLPYTLDGKRLTIQLGNGYQGQTRFCVIPTSGGGFNATGSVVFEYEGRTLAQPIGTATADVKDLEIFAPQAIATPMFNVTGYAPARSSVEIFIGNTIVGTGAANGYGAFNIACELIDPYNLSEHEVYAIINTPSKNTLKSKTKSILYDINSVKVLAVTMSQGSDIVRFDFENPDSEEKYYSYSNGIFTFTIDFNSPETIKDVLLYVHTTSGTTVSFPAKYDEKKGVWFVTTSFGTSSLPLNVSVDFNPIQDLKIDSRLVDYLYVERMSEIKNNLDSTKKEIEVIEEAMAVESQELQAKEEVIGELVNILTDDATPTAEYESNLIKFLTTIDADFDSSTLDVDNNVDYTDADIDLLLTKGESLLQNEDYDNTELVNRLSEIDTYIDSFEYGDSSLEFDVNEILEFEHEGSKFTCRQITLEEFLSIDLSTFEIEELDQTNGKSMRVYSNEKSWIVFNESEANAIIIEAADAEAMSKMRKAKGVGIAFLENLKKEFILTTEKLRDIIIDAIDKFGKDIAKIKVDIKDLEGDEAILRGNSAGKGMRIAEIERQLKELQKAGKGGYREFDLIAQKRALEIERKGLIRDIEKINKDIAPLRSKVGGLKAKLVTANTLLSEVMDYWNIIDGLYSIIKYISTGIADCIRWNSFIETILPCPKDEANALALEILSISNKESALRGYCGATTLAGLSEAISVAMKVTGGPALWALKFLYGAVSAALLQTSKDVFTQVSSDSRENLNARISDRKALNCTKKDPYDTPYFWPDNPSDPNNDNKPNPNGGKHQSGNTDTKYGIDPAGYVYEAVPTNRIEGVQATIYYKETKEDMYGDPYEDVILWNAEEYAQQNPLFTDENGIYQWDVPQGLWQVKFEKDGYTTAYSEWLPVPPPQLEVNIGITQNKQPEVIEARAYEEGVEVQFDKFMDLSTLTPSNIYVTANNEKLVGEIRLIDVALADEYADEEDAGATRYASRVRFVPEVPLSVTTGEIRVTVSRNVLSYAGIPMTATFTQVLDVEKEVQTITADNVKVLYGGEKEVIVYALPYEAAVGRTLRIANSSALIATIDLIETTFDEEGKAVLTVKGDLPGRTQLTFVIDDVTATGECVVDVVTEMITAEAPKSSRISGTAVYRGTKIELTTDSKNATVYFTTDGSCPCDENGTRRKYTVPIIINDDTKILAMTSVGTGDDDVSETVEFNYTLKRSDMDFKVDEGWTWISHNFETPITPSALAVEESVERILSQTQEVIRDPQLGMIGTLTTLSASESYKVETSSATNRQRMSDIAWNPSTPIALQSGWNWLGYPVGQTMSVDEAFAPTKAEVLDVVVGQNGFAQFDGEKWVGTLETLSPGLGYMYQSQSKKSVVYNTSIVSKASAMYATGISRTLPLAFDIHKYPAIMPIVATISNTDGVMLDNEDYQVHAFCGTECRGIGRMVNGLIMMNVYGNIGDKITLHITAAEEDKQFDNSVSLDLSETIVGSLFNPYTIAINNQTGISNNKYDGNIKVTIEGDMLRIKGIATEDIRLVEVYNIDGHKILRETYISENGIRISTLTSGVYVVVVNGNGDYTYHKLSIR